MDSRALKYLRSDASLGRCFFGGGDFGVEGLLVGRKQGANAFRLGSGRRGRSGDVVSRQVRSFVRSFVGRRMPAVFGRRRSCVLDGWMVFRISGSELRATLERTNPSTSCRAVGLLGRRGWLSIRG